MQRKGVPGGEDSGPDDPDLEDLALSPEEAADYIASLLGGLRLVAEKARLYSLSHLLGLALKEAEGQRARRDLR